MTKQKKKSPRQPLCFKNRVRLDELAPDGIAIVVDWGQFVVGSSVFIPAINTTELIAQVYEIANRYGWTLEDRFRIENGKQGVRFWRIL
jgi:hypothetical protein